MCVESAHAGLVWMTLAQQLKAEGNKTVVTVDLCSDDRAVSPELKNYTNSKAINAICDRASAL